jgi:hypothetical protein
LIVDAGEMLEIKVGIHLSRRDVCVAEQFLYAPQVLTRLEQMRSKGMPEQVRVHMDRQSLQSGPSSDTRLDGAMPHTTAVATREERCLTRVGMIPAHLEPGLKRLDGFSAYGLDARFIALAGDPNGSIGEIDDSEIECDEF